MCNMTMNENVMSSYIQKITVEFTEIIGRTIKGGSHRCFNLYTLSGSYDKNNDLYTIEMA